MKILQKIIENNPESEFLIADGFDDAIIGICYNSQKLIYSYQKCVNILVSNYAMQEIDAIEYLDFNTINSYVGENTPIWCME